MKHKLITNPLQFLEKYNHDHPNLEMVEDLRTLLIYQEVSFRQNQLNGCFTDGTGDGFLEGCLESIAKKRGEL
jgi:hypothetical protein